MNMKKISYLCLLPMAMGVVSPCCAGYNDKQFRNEIRDGLDLIVIRESDVVVNPDAGEMGTEVYQNPDDVDNAGMRLFVPATRYVRAGAGLTLAFATDDAEMGGVSYKSSGSYATQIGIGWNLSPVVRAELDFQEMTMKFSDLKDMGASYHTGAAMMYFDIMRRYAYTGDIVCRRRVVPFIGFGAAVGWYAFDGADGANGFVAAPRAAAGVNIMLNDLIGIDIEYQYQMMIGDGFGWGVSDGSSTSISNIMASFRANF